MIVEGFVDFDYEIVNSSTSRWNDLLCPIGHRRKVGIIKSLGNLKRYPPTPWRSQAIAAKVTAALNDLGFIWRGVFY